MSQVRVTGAPAAAGVVVKAEPTVVGPPGPVGPAGPAGATGPQGASGGEIPELAVADGDATPDPGNERLAWSTVTNSLVMYVQGHWRVMSPGISVGNTPPANPLVNQIWVDTN